MRYILLINATRASFGAVEDRSRRFRRELTSSGELIADAALSGPHEARVVVAGEGGPRITATFPSEREFLAAYWLVDCASPARAIAIAARIAGSRGVPVEVRPIMTAPGEEM
jgi:hypothetical protein